MSLQLRAAREQFHCSQRQISAVLNINQSTYSRYESGAINIPVDILIQLAQFYQTSVDYLLGLTNNPKPIR